MEKIEPRILAQTRDIILHLNHIDSGILIHIHHIPVLVHKDMVLQNLPYVWFPCTSCCGQGHEEAELNQNLPLVHQCP